MIKFTNKLFIFAATTSILVGLLFVPVRAQESTEISDTQINAIKNSCSSVKQTLSQLRSSDALLRVNRGQNYESITTKLMKTFNSRVMINSLDNTNLSAVTNDFDKQLATFREDYLVYEKQLTKTANMDCENKPVDFYYAVADTRTKRTKLHDDVINLNQLIKKYRLVLTQFKTDFLSGAGTNNG